jgi:hypothetical protein
MIFDQSVGGLAAFGVFEKVRFSAIFGGMLHGSTY